MRVSEWVRQRGRAEPSDVSGESTGHMQSTGGSSSPGFPCGNVGPVSPDLLILSGASGLRAFI